MTDVPADFEPAPTKRSKLRLLLPIVLAVAAAGAGFAGAGKVLFSAPGHESDDPGHAPEPPASVDFAFVALDPMTVSLAGGAKHLRFAAQVEVARGTEAEVSALMPRMVDVLQDYLRAVSPEDLSSQESLIRLRSQMLRRLQIVAGPEKVRDLLIMEFVLN